MQEVMDNTKTTNEFKKVKNIDFNCDLAQSFGVYKNDKEFELLDYVSSVNIATGFHAGDPVTIKNALLKAKGKNVVIGAHIGFNDIQGFGSRAMDLNEEEVEALVVYQVSALTTFAKSYGLEIEHIRPHGAMYRLAAENFMFSAAVAKAIKKCSKWLTYYGAAGDVLTKVSEYVEIPVAQEIKLDKIYNPEGTIDYRAEEIKDTEYSLKRLNNYLRNIQIDNNANGRTVINADSIHFSNSENALELVKRANELIKPVPVNYTKAKASGWV